MNMDDFDALFCSRCNSSIIGMKFKSFCKNSKNCTKLTAICVAILLLCVKVVRQNSKPFLLLGQNGFEGVCE